MKGDQQGAPPRAAYLHHPLKNQHRDVPPPPSLPPCLFFCSVFLCVAAGHPAAGATLHLQELVVFLRQPVRQRHQSERTS